MITHSGAIIIADYQNKSRGTYKLTPPNLTDLDQVKPILSDCFVAGVSILYQLYIIVKPTVLIPKLYF